MGFSRASSSRHRDGNCGKHKADLQDGWEDGVGRTKNTRKPRVFVVEARRLGDPPSWWTRGLGTWGMWRIEGRYATKAGAENALRDMKAKCESYPYSYGRSEFRLRYPVKEAEVAP